MSSLGQDLKKERELRGISLKEISDSTKINIHFLQALEDDRLEMLPGGFFIKGILRSYAGYLGLEDSAVLNKYYEEEQRRRQNEEGGETLENADSSPKIPKSFRNKVFFALTFVVILAVLSSIYFIFHKDQKEAPQINSIPVSAPMETELPLSQPITKPEEPVKATEMNLVIDFQQKTWIQLFIDGELRLDGIKYPGETFTAIARNEIIFNLGNAGGLSYTINETPGKSFGKSGVVVKNIQITLENLKDFLAVDTHQSDGQER